MASPNSSAFQSALRAIFAQESAAGRPFVDINAGQLHRQVGGYPGPGHRMPTCCHVMRSEMQPGDEILSEPPKGKGANLTIRYRLPRPGVGRGGAQATPAAATGALASAADSERPWHWEGKVQSAIVAHLEGRGYSIESVASAATKQPGKDIVARRFGQTLWVTVKGYPEATERTGAATQARHWFKDALFDVVDWRGENGDAELAMGLPDYPTYRRLAERVRWLQPVARFRFLWVREDGSVLEG